jgi:hypothetical protein
MTLWNDLHSCASGQRVRRCAGENKINIAVGLEDFTDSIAHARSPTVLAIGWRVMRVGFLQCGRGLRANRCDVIARKFMALLDHLACLLRSFCAGSISTKRLPDSSEPWASEFCQANPVRFALQIACSSFILISETGGKLIVPAGKIFSATKDCWFHFA